MLEVRGIDNDHAIALDAVAGRALRMVQGKRADRQRADLDHAALGELVEVAFGGNLAEVDRKIRLRHLSFERFLQRLTGGARKERDVVLGPVERSEKRDALNVVPVEMRQEDIGLDRLPFRFLQQSLTERADAAARVENDAFIIGGSDLDAGCVAAELQVFNLRRGRRPANTPESEPYLSTIH